MNNWVQQDTHLSLGGCVIQMPGHPLPLLGLDPKVTRAAAAQVGATDRFKFPE